MIYFPLTFESFSRNFFTFISSVRIPHKSFISALINKAFKEGTSYYLFISKKKKKYHLQKYLSLNIHPPLVLQRMSEMRAHTSLLGRNSSSVGWSFKPETHSTNRSQWGAPPGNQAGYLWMWRITRFPKVHMPFPCGGMGHLSSLKMRGSPTKMRKSQES